MNPDFDKQGDSMHSRMKCLLVDDVAENLHALSALLRRDDVELLEARSGIEALELLLVHDVALAFLDVQMPDMDGFELAELMRGSERTRHVPLIFVTAGTRDQLRLFKGYEAGAVDFLYKPIDSYILKSKADVFFQLHHQKRQLANELRERTQALHLNEMFMAILGHDLRTPLSTILTSAGFIQRCSDDQKVQEATARMLSSGRRMSRMIEDILDVARARLAGGIAIKPEPADLGALVQRVVRELQMAFSEREVEVLCEGDLNGEWDANRLAQAVSNLIGNSLQHGEVGHAIRVAVDGKDGDIVILSVANAGRIPADVLPYIFDPFVRATQQPRRSDGLGLGLYIVQQIIQAHRGSIEVQSTDGRQTLFRVKVPRKTDETGDRNGSLVEWVSAVKTFQNRLS